MAYIDDTYTIELPNGTREDVNIFDYNLNHVVDGYVECESGVYIRAKRCKIIRSNREE